MASTTQPSTLPFAHLNLRRNPFGEFSADENAALAEVDVDPFVAFLSQADAAVQFVGEKGYGKTTHLLALRARFAGAGYVHIAEGEWGTIPTGSPLLIDEAQRLTRWQQFRVFRRHVPLVLGTHVDFAEPLRRAGRRVMTVPVEGRMNPERLARILNARIDWVRRREGPLPHVRVETASRLLERYGPDVRRVLHELYLLFQQMSTIHDV